MALSIMLPQSLFSSSSSLHPISQFNSISLFSFTCLVGIIALLISRRREIYIMDFACFNPPSRWRVPSSAFMEYSKLVQKFDEKSIEFQQKIVDRAGLRNLTSLPTSLHFMPPRICIAEERRESECVLFGVIDALLLSVPHVKPHQIGVLVTNCSVFSPTPSMSSLIVHKYKLPPDVKSFNLAGMGCSAGIIALDLAKRVLLAHPNMYALVLSTENLTRRWYLGNDRSKLVTNCLFRVGGSAVLLSNKRADRRKSKYRVLHTVRSHIGAHNNAYRCVYEEEDWKGAIGISLSKDLMQCASLAIEHNMKMLGPKVLPTWEILVYIWHVLIRKVSYAGAHVKPYIPKFKLAFAHVCIHAGGKVVVHTVSKSLDLPHEMSEASHMTLYRYGNVSSASVWYALAYEEAKGRVKRGNKVWQIGLGSGFKCCSSVLKALKTIDPYESCTTSCWADSLRDLPCLSSH